MGRDDEDFAQQCACSRRLRLGFIWCILGGAPLRRGVGRLQKALPEEEPVRESNINSAPALGLHARAKAIGLVVAAALLLAGGVVSFYSASSYDRGKRSLLWPTVRGALVTIDWHGEKSAESSTFPTVQYQYDFAGKLYAGSNTCFGAASEATCKLAGLQAGQKVNVFVNAVNPQESVLLPGPSGFAQACLVAGVVLMILGLIVGGSSLAYNAPKR